MNSLSETSSLTVTLLGDSLTAGYGLKPSESLPVRLAESVSAFQPTLRIVGAGVSGDTLRDGLRRWRIDVPSETDICVLALGANDMMQRKPIDQIRADLTDLIRQLASAGFSVLLCGMRAPPWYGQYATDFDALFPQVAREFNVPLMPFLLQGVTLDPAFVLPDRIHPNAAGVEVMSRNLAPFVEAAARDLITKRSQGQTRPIR